MSELQHGWAIASLGDICGTGQYGWTTKAANQGSVKYLRTTDITKGRIDWHSVPYCHKTPSELDKYLIQDNDILISRAGSVGFSTLIKDIPSPTVFASYLIRFIPSKNIEPRYVAYSLISPEYWKQISDASTGIALANVNAKKLAELRIPVAPLKEQKRIADKLDALLARVDASRERLNRIPLILKRFRQVVLALATSGQLTEDWRTSRESTQWQRMSLSEICLSITDGDHQAPPQAKRGVPFITIAAINDGRLRIDKATRFVPSVYFEQMKASRKPQMGDILFSVTGSIAISALVDTREPFTFQRHIAILKPDLSRISSSFLRYALETEDIKRQALSVATGTAQLTVPLSGLRAFMLDIPARDEQDEIVSRVEAIFAYAERLEARYQAARTQVERLTPALLAKAFRGELVPQDPNDEPASVMLERIRAERATPLAKPKRSQADRKQTMTKMTEESVKEAIGQLPKDQFSFDELRENLPGDYDSLKDILFALLSEAEPSLTQIFDQEERTMCFVRAGK